MSASGTISTPPASTDESQPPLAAVEVAPEPDRLMPASIPEPPPVAALADVHSLPSDVPEPEDATERALGVRRQRRASAALTTLAVLAIVYSMYFARAFLLPVFAAIVLTLLLRPLMRRCRRYHIPDACSAAGALGLLLLISGGVLVNLISPAREWIDTAPENLRVVGEKLTFIREQIQEIDETSEKVLNLGAEEDQAAQSGDGESVIAETFREWTGAKDAAIAAKGKEPIPVEVRQSKLLTGVTLLTTTGGVFASLVVAIVLTFFLLTTGDRLLNNVLRVLPSFREKRSVVELVYEVERGISSYLLTVTLINLGLGLAIGTAMWLLGMPNPALWGAMGTGLNFIPYLGAAAGTLVVFLVAVFSFDSLPYACLVPLAYFALTAIEGNVITPSLLGKRMSLSPIFVFLSLVFWGWMWGVGGALLAVPILAILKVSFDQFERTEPLGTLLGE